MLTFSDEGLRTQIQDGELKSNADHIAFLPFSDLKKSVTDDIAILKASPLLLDTPITGYIYEVETGKIVQV
jgi:carbonic anhydrase